MYYEYDYEGSMDYFQRQLEKKGITVEQLDITDYAGLTFKELQWVVDHAESVIRSRQCE